MDRQRLDKWLWHARVVKARTSAAALVEAGHVRINGVRETAPGHAVKAGDVLTIGLDRSVRVLKVIGFSERRGDASSARVLYEDPARRAAREAGTLLRRLAEPEDIAGVALMLASRAGAYITGQTIVVDGGTTIAS